MKYLLITLVLLFFPTSLHAAVKIRTSLGTAKINATMRLSTSSPNLIGHWTFDGKDILNGMPLDISGNGSHGNFISISTSTFYRPGRTGQGISPDFVNDRVDMGDNALYDFTETDSFAISIWFKSARQSAQTLVSKKQNSAATAGYYVSVVSSGGQVLSLVFADGTNEASLSHTGVTGLLDGRWHHVVVNVNRVTNVVSSFVDGVGAGNTSIANVGSLVNTTSLRLGVLGNGSVLFSGGLDEFRIYNKVLATTTIEYLYNTGSRAFRVRP